MDRDPGQILTHRLDLPGMQADPELHPQGPDRIPHRAGATDRPGRTGAGREEAITSGGDLAAPARSIGVSNFSLAELDQLLSDVRTPPVTNQVQFSPLAFRRRLLQGREERSVALEAYSPLGTGRHLRDRRVGQVAERVGRTPAQVLLRWCLQRNLVVLPKSTHRERIVENARIFDFTLSAEDMAALDALDKTGGTDRALEHTWW